MTHTHTTDEPSAPETTEQKQTFTERVEQKKASNAAPDPFCIATDNLAGVRLFENRHDRVMVLAFDEEPSPGVLKAVKHAGYRWSPKDKVWDRSLRLESASTTRLEAYRLYEEVRGMIRQEKGVESTPEVPF